MTAATLFDNDPAPGEGPKSRLRQRQPRTRDRKYCEWIASLPCLKCYVQLNVKTHGVHVAHVRFGDLERGKRPTGAGEKPADCWTVPLCPTHHMIDQHGQAERDFWAKLGVDVIAVCLALQNASMSRETAQQVFEQARRAVLERNGKGSG